MTGLSQKDMINFDIIFTRIASDNYTLFAKMQFDGKCKELKKECHKNYYCLCVKRHNYLFHPTSFPDISTPMTQWKIPCLLYVRKRNLFSWNMPVCNLSCLYIVMLVVTTLYKNLRYIRCSSPHWRQKENNSTCNEKVYHIRKEKYSKFCVFHDEPKKFITT